MLRCLALLLILLGATNAQGQQESDPKRITRDRQQIFVPLGERAANGNAGMFVGVNHFTQDATLNKLNYAVHDAVETAYLFAYEVKLIHPARCFLLLSGEPESEVVQQHLDQLKRQGAVVATANRSKILQTFLTVSELARKESDLMVCSFSSHGFEDRGDAYVMPADGIRRLLADTAVPLTTIERNMERSKAGHRLLLVDACQERVAAKGVAQAGDPAGEALLAAFQKPSGQAKLASCSPGEFSYENSSLDGVGHGVFTWAFLEALRGGATADQHQLVRLGSVAEYVAARVSAWTTETRHKKQTPFLTSPIETRNLPLAEKADDMTTLLASLKQQPVSGRFTEMLRNDLAEYLGELDPSSPEDRELLSATRDFLAGKLLVNRFVAFVKNDQPRWQTAPIIEGSRAGEIRVFGKQPELTMVWCPAGQFTMGSPSGEAGRGQDEHQHTVALKNGFWIGQTEVTQAQWQAVMPSEPWRGKQQAQAGGQIAASYIGWQDAVAFCQRLAQLARQDKQLGGGWTFRLPTESQWEYACRAGSATAYSFGNSSQPLDQHAWYRNNSTDQGQPYAHAVGQRQPNAWNLFDMHGNVAEWCRDVYNERYEATAEMPRVDQTLPRSLRGGSWNIGSEFCRSAARNAYRGSSPGAKQHGFRIVLEPTDSSHN